MGKGRANLLYMPNVKKIFTCCLTMLLLCRVLFPSLFAQTRSRTVLFSEWTSSESSLKAEKEVCKTTQNAFRWTWRDPNAALSLKDSALKTVVNNPRATFVVWIYNDKPVKDSLSFSFLKNNKKLLSFNFGLNFKGWRTAWVMYQRDMQGKAEGGMNTLMIGAPKSVNKGELVIDGIRLNAEINPRSPMRDVQVPFVNIHSDKAANSHWTSLYLFSRQPHSLNRMNALSRDEQADILTISKRHEKYLLETSKASGITDIKNRISLWGIRRSKENIYGRPVLSMNDAELYTAKEEKQFVQDWGVKKYTELMLDVALAYEFSSDIAFKKTLEADFINLFDHFENQGWSFGSGMGALHHLGYNLRSYYTACFLMKESLTRAGRLEQAFKSMSWFCGLGRINYYMPGEPLSNIDVFNTLLTGMLSTILMLDTGLEKGTYLLEFSQWLSKCMEPDRTIAGAFKPDGAVFHHGNLYPAYATGGFDGIAPIVYMLNNTSFAIKPEAHSHLKESLLMMHLYTNPVKWPMSVSGRHPTGTWKMPSRPFGLLALAGNPERTSAIDSSMAGVYLAITRDKRDRLKEKFVKEGFKPALYPKGHWNMNYGLLDIHRRQDWLLTLRGHNRYFTTHEAYPGANMYGRYLSYGHLEVLYPETYDSSGSNFNDLGWDWNSIPGTTSVHVPLSKLRADIKNVDDFSGVEEMLLSDQIFAGGTNLDAQGVFAMKLRGHDKYEMGSFRANKSWFMFDSLVVCLGSNIESAIDKYSVQTTLFQNSSSIGSSLLLGNRQIEGFPVSYRNNVNAECSIIDDRKIGYFIPAGQQLLLTKGLVSSRNHKDTENTSGVISKLILEHGVKPSDSSYEYCMLVNTTRDKMASFVNTQESKSPVYKVLQKNSLIHSVYFVPQRLTSLVIFSGSDSLKDSLLRVVDKPSLIMYKRVSDEVRVSVTDPDLRFYEGPDDSPIINGKRKEVSIYSRSWYKKPSKPSVLSITIRGNYKVVSGGENIKLINKNRDGITKLEVQCRDGIASKFTLKSV